MFQGGGNIPLILPIAARLVAHGHYVRVLAGPGIRLRSAPVSASFQQRVLASGAEVVPYQEPSANPHGGASSPRGLVGGWTPRQLVDASLNAPPYRWSPVWAANVAVQLKQSPVDVVVADYLLPGALAAAEAAGLPAVALVHGFYKHRPATGLPAMYTGFMPARNPLSALRDTLHNAAVHRVYKREALPFLNAARKQLGLAPLRSPFDQYDRAARVLILASAALDFPARRLPSNVRYVGTPFDDAGSPAWASPWPSEDARPLVVVSLSTLSQGQAPVIRRTLEALAGLPVRALVTLGPSLVTAEFHAPPNVILETFVPHASVLPQTSGMVTQCGMGTMIKALAHGVPLVCLPLLGDQPANAARAAARGAGVRLGRGATVDQIRSAIQRVLSEPSFREAANRISTELQGEDGAERAAEELEAIAAAG